MNDLYNCFHCDAINRATQNAWCCCVGTENTLVCEKCGRCFCDAPNVWKKKVWAVIGTIVAHDKVTYVRPIILIIDDDRVIHSVSARVLAHFPGTVLHAYDGKEGLRMAKEIKPDVVITDCLLPIVDGREIARLLKADPETRAIRIIAMTAMYRGARYRHEALTDFAVDEYIEKPVSAAMLREIASATVRGEKTEPASVAAVLP